MGKSSVIAAQKHVVFTANGSAGGQGKTLVNTTLAEIRRKRTGDHPRLVDCDAEHSLARMLGSAVIQLPIAAKADEIMSDPALLAELWDNLGRSILDEGDCFVDLGANVDSAVFEWARNCAFYEDLREAKVDVVVPVKAEPKAVSQARNLVAVIADVFPEARISVVLNRYKPWRDYADEEKEIRSWPGVTVVDMPLCASKIWQRLEKEAVTPLAAAELGSAKLAAELSLDTFVARREVGTISAWVRTMTENFAYIWE
ncbi:MAG: hypothetical protein WCJ64_00630 [Rhodospirillaceae bacterium]